MQHATPMKAYTWLRRGQGRYDDFPDDALWRSTAYNLRRLWPDYLNFRRRLADIAKAHEPLPYWDGSPLAPTDWLCPIDDDWHAPHLADPSNVDLRVGGVPLILPPRRRLWPVAPVAENARILGNGIIQLPGNPFRDPDNGDFRLADNEAGRMLKQAGFQIPGPQGAPPMKFDVGAVQNSFYDIASGGVVINRPMLFGT